MRKTYLHHEMTSINDLNTYLGNFFGGGFVVMNHNFWVQRKAPAGFFGGGIPDSSLHRSRHRPATFGWPRKTTDRAAGVVPIISDACFSGYGSPADQKRERYQYHAR